MQLLKVSGKMIQIGDDKKTASYYFLTEKTPLNGLKVGDSVEFKWEKRGGSKYLTKLTKTSGGQSSAPVEKATVQEAKKEEKRYEEPKVAPKLVQNDSLNRKEYSVPLPQVSSVSNSKLEIGKMTAETLIALQGKVTELNVLDLIDKIFDKYASKVKS